MASAKDSPRQKMIGMMYLVLTALLALNVSKEILNAFVVVNKGIENTNETFTGKNEQLYASFDLAKSVDPVKATPSWEKAQQVKNLSGNIVSYIDELKKTLVMETEGVEKSIADTLQLKSINNKDNYDVPTNILIGESEDGSNGKAHELKIKLEEYHQTLMNMVHEKDKKAVNTGIKLEAPTEGEVAETWETYNFYHAPLAASITLLSKLQSDVKNAEYTLVEYLLRELDSDMIKFDTIAAKVIAQSNYVLLGEPYKADLFIAAFSKTQKPGIYIGDYNEQNNSFTGSYDSIPVTNGLGKYEVNTSKEGVFNYEGVIKVKTPKGKIIPFPFRSEYIVAKPSLAISADNMNVFYMKVENPITVSVPGIPSERIQPSTSNGQLRSLGNGKYEISNVTGTSCQINVMATMENGDKKSMGSLTFRVKPLPAPFATFAGRMNNSKLKKNEIEAQAGLIAKYSPDFLFQRPVRVSSFKVSVFVSRLGSWQEKNIQGNALDEPTKAILRGLRKGDKIVFESIKAIDVSNTTHTLNDIMITVD